MVQDSRAKRRAGVHEGLAHVQEAVVGVPGDPEAAGGPHREGTEAREGILRGV